jgi:hypothetical protein
MVKTYTLAGPESNMEKRLDDRSYRMTGPVTVTSGLERIDRTVTELDRRRRRVLKHFFISSAPFAEATLLRERVVRCIFRITSSWLAGIPVLLALRVHWADPAKGERLRSRNKMLEVREEDERAPRQTLESQEWGDIEGIQTLRQDQDRRSGQPRYGRRFTDLHPGNTTRKSWPNQQKKNQQIYVDWGTAMTDFTDFATFCINQQFADYLLLIRTVQWPNQQNIIMLESFFESFVIFWNFQL